MAEKIVQDAFVQLQQRFEMVERPAAYPLHSRSPVQNCVVDSAGPATLKFDRLADPGIATAVALTSR